jgi:hypothetical protein
MDWGVIAALLTVLSVNIGLFLHLAGKIDAIRSDIHQETKDFHGRLCSLEARWHGEKNI